MLPAIESVDDIIADEKELIEAISRGDKTRLSNIMYYSGEKSDTMIRQMEAENAYMKAALEVANTISDLYAQGFGRHASNSYAALLSVSNFLAKSSGDRETYRTKFKIKHIPKGNGKYREIYALNNSTKEQIKEHIPYLKNRLIELDNLKVNYAFTEGRNCIMGALQHVDYKYTLSLDIENFFDSITGDHLKGLIRHNILNELLFDGAIRQGPPTSPILSNIAFLKCDQLIVDNLKAQGIQAIYTRYADDLTFSFDDIKSSGKILFIVQSILKEHHFNLNNNKTKLQSYKNGRRIITGVGVDNYGVHPTRKTLKKIRAAEHQLGLYGLTQSKRSLKGLKEWAKCKLPSSSYN